MANVVVRPTADVAKKWVDVAGGRGDAYAAGVKNPRRPWQAQAAAAVPTWKVAISAAGIDRRMLGGIAKAGDAKQIAKASTLGKDRYGPGVGAAQADFAAGFDPYNQTIGATTLPERKPRGDPANYNRSKAMGDALHAKRLSLLGAGA